ncbi:MAG: SDR family oxidoreductase [Spirochaetaceae bacterium]|nr:MAG: SDR family oxidoreductase [Spirochaetaceae bacterium]
MEPRYSEEQWLRQFSLKEAVIVITGSTRGIGYTLARACADLGATVWVHGRDPEQCRARATELGAGARWVAADLGKPREVRTFCDTILSGTPVVHCLINNAAKETHAGLHELDQALLEEIFQVNLHAPVLITSGLLPALEAAGGASVINMTSIHQSVPYGRNGAYCMTKAALDMYTRTASLELAPRGIRVNSLAPGAIETDINRDVLEEIGRDAFARWIPAGRVGSTEELIGAVVYLASGASSYVTGSTIVVDGGYSRNLVRYWAGEEEHGASAR